MPVYTSESRTEDLVIDLLRINDWSEKKPPKGNTIFKNEYKNFSQISEYFVGKSKTGNGDGYPDFTIVNKDTLLPTMIIEAKSDVDKIKAASSEAQDYAELLIKDGIDVLAIGVAGQEETSFKIEIFRYVNGSWVLITYNDIPIQWIPRPADLVKLHSDAKLTDLRPVVPNVQILSEKAELINRILRESNVKDEYRAAYVGAMMLGLWKSRGNIRKDPEYILRDINGACYAAFRDAGKVELARSLRIDEANTKLANSSWKILSTLEKLNIVTASFDHDYLGQIYEMFFRYTGGNTIGQYFTPRHITRFMAEICEVTENDKVIDPACGTGGFLIGSIEKVFQDSDKPYDSVIDMVKNNLYGFESEPVTASLCVANMILRGDGKTGISKDDCFTAPNFPIGECQVALMNPPFPHRTTDTPPQDFIDRALEALDTRGKLAVILPTSLIVKKEHSTWREKILKENTLLSVIQLPDEVFQPFASATTSIVLLEKGVPHSNRKSTVFARIQYDGLILKKGVRVKRADGKNQLNDAVDAILNKKEIPGFTGLSNVSGGQEWAPGAYIPSTIPTENELKNGVDELLRRLGSFYIRYALEVNTQRERIADGDLRATNYKDLISKKKIENAASLPNHVETIGQYFEIFYGMKELHSRDGIPPGDSLIISPRDEYNGCYGWLEFTQLINPAFITVAQTGSIGEAFVQLEPCAVNDDCLILLPREDGVSLSRLFIAASILHNEKWRFNYGRKLTPARICQFPMAEIPELEEWVEQQLLNWMPIWELAVNSYKQEQVQESI